MATTKRLAKRRGEWKGSEHERTGTGPTRGKGGRAWRGKRREGEAEGEDEAGIHQSSPMLPIMTRYGSTSAAKRVAWAQAAAVSSSFIS